MRCARFAFIILLARVANPALAQTTTGGLLGRVDGGGAAVAGASVVVTGPALPVERSTSTDERGAFVVPFLPPGSYAVRIRAVGFRPLDVHDTPVLLGHLTEVARITLEPAALVLEPISVAAADLHANTTGTVVGEHVTDRDYAALPVARDFHDIIELLPLANHSYYPGDHTSVLGATGFENTFYVDGVNVTDPGSGGPGGLTLPYNFVRAIEIEQGGLDARFGGTTGGLTNAVTYSGGEHFSGEAFGFLTSSGFQSSPLAGSGQTFPVSFANYDAGVRLGGPLRSHRLWYSAAYNPQVERTEQSIPGFGNSPDQLVRHLFAGKLTWQATAGTLLEASLLGERSNEDVVNTGLLPGGFRLLSTSPLLETRRYGWTAGALRATSQPAHGVELEARASLIHWTGSTGPRTAAGNGFSLADALASTLSGGTGEWDTSRSARAELSLQSVFSLGAHRVTAGAEYQETSSRDIGGYWTLNHADTNLWISDSLATQGTRIAIRLPSLYVQDFWNVSRQLTLGAGLRWSRQSITANGHAVETLADEWQPRLSFSLRLGQHEQRIFGTWGIVFQQQPIGTWGFIFGQNIYPQRYYSADPRSGAAADSTNDYGNAGSAYAPGQAGVYSENYVESTVGFAPVASPTLRITARAIHRSLRSTAGYGFDSANGLHWGTPGSGDLRFLPRAQRYYDALELSATWEGPRGLWASASYVLSWLQGNYIGHYDERGFGQTLALAVQVPASIGNSFGYLPNDRRHLVKLLVVRPLGRRLALGAFATWMSGTPLNAFGLVYGIQRFTFLVPRGTAGRLPSLWDLSVRSTWRLPIAGRRVSLVTDVQHLLSQRREVYRDQLKLLPNGAGNPDFGAALLYAPPMQVHVGVTVGLGAAAEPPGR